MIEIENYSIPAPELEAPVQSQPQRAYTSQKGKEKIAEEPSNVPQELVEPESESHLEGKKDDGRTTTFILHRCLQSTISQISLLSVVETQ